MRIVRGLSLVGLLTVLACGGSGEEPTPSLKGRLEVVHVIAPPVVGEFKSFHVEAVVADPVGIESVALVFDEQRRVWSGDGRRRLRITTDIQPTRFGRFPIEIQAVATDGVQTGRSPSSVDVTTATDTLGPSIESHVFLDRVALWAESGLTKDELYARGPWYGPPIPAELYPFFDEWWLDWMDAGGAQPFQWQEHCPGVTEVTPYGEVLRCWLALHPNVAESMIWVGVNASNGLPLVSMYPAWTEAMKADLDEAFFFAWHWLDSSLTWPFGIPPDPPANQLPPSAERADVALSQDQAWRLYVATVAHSLALEVGGFVPWSVVGYHPDDLRVLFHAYSMFEVGQRSYPDGTTFLGHFTNGVLHAHPKTTFQFLVDQNIIRENHYQTIVQLLEWSGENLSHTTNHKPEDYAKTDMEFTFTHWQYYGWQPVARVLAGTWRDDWYEHTHWTRGCIGTSRMYVSILRALNIPSYWLYGNGQGNDPHLDGHHTPVFSSIGMALSHGDDMLNWFRFKDGVTPPPSHLRITRILMDWPTFVDWFYIHPNHNVGRQKYEEIPIDVLPDDLLELYCADQQASPPLPLGQTQVFAEFAEHHTVADLQARLLWVRLAEKAALLGRCE